jgi:hypothetical protein
LVTFLPNRGVPLASGGLVQTGTGIGRPGGSLGPGDVSTIGLRSHCFTITISPTISPSSMASFSARVGVGRVVTNATCCLACFSTAAT